jgi:nicotinamidase-related amidase
LPHIQRLLAAARASRLPVIHVTGLEAIVGWRDSTRRGQRYEGSTPDARDRLRRRYDIIDEVAPLDGEAVIRKSSPSAFWGTPLVGHLRYLDVDTLIIAGESTSGCVRATVVDGRTHRFHMLVPEECVFDRHEASHAMNLFDMDQKYADVVAVDDAIAYILSCRPFGQAEHRYSDNPGDAGELGLTSPYRRQP